MERKHKIYFIISGIVYLLLYFTFKIAIIKNVSSTAYQVYNYSQLLILVLAFIFGIRNSVRAIAIWLGIICGDLLFYLYYIILSIYKLELVSINVFNFGLIIVAIVSGFMSLNMNTITSGNFSKMYRKPAIVFFVCSILYYVLMSISGMEFYWFYEDYISERSLNMLNYSLRLFIVISVMIIAISKIVKRKTFGFVFTTVLVVWHFALYILLTFSSSISGFPVLLFRYDAIKSNPILYCVPMILFRYNLYILIFQLLFSIILLTNFLFYLKRDPELIPTKSNDVKPSSGVTK